MIIIPKICLLPLLILSSGGWCDGLGNLPVPERPTIWIVVGHGPTALAVGAGGGCLDIFTLVYPFSICLPLFGRRPDLDRNTVSKCR